RWPADRRRRHTRPIAADSRTAPLCRSPAAFAPAGARTNVGRPPSTAAAQQHIESFEELLPQPPDALPLLIQTTPVAMRQSQAVSIGLTNVTGIATTRLA